MYVCLIVLNAAITESILLKFEVELNCTLDKYISFSSGKILVFVYRGICKKYKGEAAADSYSLLFFVLFQEN